ncbi:DivIVA domain-containing protein [Rhodococcus chondri]|uniref:DivIVA domain-containing protein n=1 Tax=Rhodococcus chondri TaxID=3065941 RepID=A0ABU7JV97_9NOCA|nr:DivIVA domain-containing protein [Rhodococcus sp. CC-R104]MEE2033682.1 DivIVA domain-containing protein [Rhodococcus sp. CC-R104]
MLTVLLYVGVMVLVGAVLFFVASTVFGRGEALAPIPPGTTTTVLPASDVTGRDIRDLRFQQVLRGYKMSEVDWALDRMAREIDDLRARLDEYEATAAPDEAAPAEASSRTDEPDPADEPVPEVVPDEQSPHSVGTETRESR